MARGWPGTPGAASISARERSGEFVTGEVVPAPEPPRASAMRLRCGQYLVVFGLIVLSYALCAVQDAPTPRLIALLVQLLAVALILRVAEARLRVLRVVEVRPRVLRIAEVVLLLLALAVVIAWASGSDGIGVEIALPFSSTLAYLAAPLAIIGHQRRRRRIDVEPLIAAVSAYVLLGMFFALLLNFSALISPTPLFGEGMGASLSDQLLFSFTTLTTTGYGNLVPQTPVARSIAITEALIGQLFLVVAIARVVTGLRPAHRPELLS